MLKTAEEMSKAIRRIVKRQLSSAQNSQYDVLVCIRSVDAARAVFESVPVEGTAMVYGNAVMAELDKLHETYWDNDGEYTSRGMVGDVCTDVGHLLKRQWSLEHPHIDEKEARTVLIREMAELSRLIPGPPGDTGETVIMIEAQGESGTLYHVATTFEVTAPREFDMHGKIYADETRQILICEDRLELICDD